MRPLITGIGALALVGALLSGCGGDDEQEQAAAFCEDVEALQERFAGIGSASVPDPEVMAEVSTAFDDLAGDAPDAIADDMTALAEALGALSELLEGVDLSDPSTMARLQDEAAELQDQLAGVQEASTNVQAYLDEECGIDEAVPVPDADGGERTGDEGTGDEGTGTEGSG